MQVKVNKFGSWAKFSACTPWRFLRLPDMIKMAADRGQSWKIIEEIEARKAAE